MTTYVITLMGSIAYVISADTEEEALDIAREACEEDYPRFYVDESTIREGNHL